MKALYVSEVSKELAKYADCKSGVITENDIAGLPEPVQKYFRHCGHLGKEKMANAEITWKDVYFKNSPHKKWMSLKCYQFNSVPQPTRIVYMKSSLMGLFPFEGRDKYQDGHGNMLIKLLKVIPVVNARSKEMDQSALVTVLAESLIVPAYALRDYIKWTSLDANSAGAEIEYNKSRAGGIFYFNDSGEFTRFETGDRYYSENGKDYERKKWSAVAANYILKNGIRFPSYFKAVWHTGEGDYEYFKGTITGIRFNISVP